MNIKSPEKDNIPQEERIENDNGTPFFNDQPNKTQDDDATKRSRYNRMLNILEFLGVKRIAATGMFMNLNTPGIYNSNLRGCLGRVVQNLKRKFIVTVGERSITSNGYTIEGIEKSGKYIIDHHIVNN